ncbi:putative aldehyde dehydrogenase AldX [Paenibacillus terrae HPL-003]|uniref:Putative aldehyde dehydrogenase AldX n=1 Tax=Paenibacillus terrae (strain HPL-003) TaxID=985665 RepID=G7VYL9_PAETH|nr:aldehyde dehydrogenase family protein [Paenibacillus terrae]AET59009.1 putative aldehyde dehydrogenase AldX [Paenibacillus terrae HPL-003]
MEQLTSEQVSHILQQHRQFFHSGHTRSVEFRLEQLRKLTHAIQRYELPIMAALYQDLLKNEFEAYTTEIGFTLDSIRYMTKHLKRWMKPQKVKTPIYHPLTKSYMYKEPYGTVLIVGPFNYPFQLLIEPLIGAIAGGNGGVLKPSNNTLPLPPSSGS